MKATPEQQAICESTAEILKIKAGAGTGKTTTLMGLSARHPNQRMLYLAFNKAIKEEAQTRFSRNVRAMTAHGLAYGQVGRDYSHKLSGGDLKPFHALPLLAPSLSQIPKGLHNLYGGRVVETVKAFLISADGGLGEEHVSVGLSPGEKRHFSPEAILNDAQRLWDSMQDLSSPTPMMHDGYLKLFQLSAPRLPYDTLLLDEAQDTNPVTQALVASQAGRCVYVGDEHQAIYGFRGARNAMALIDADEEHLLTGSFRFGPAVADLANALLTAKGEKELRLRGLGQPTQLGPLPPQAPFAFLSRGNSALFARAIQALDDRTRFAFVGPLGNYRFDLIEQTYHLSQDNRAGVKDAFLNSFASLEEMDEYAQAMGDKEIQGRCKLVEKYLHRIPGLIAQIQARAGTYPGPATQLILTSAHRAKGLEFDHVRLANDFMDFYDEKEGQWKDLTQASEDEREEVNLQYVAVTRAKLSLEIGDKLEDFWQRSLAQEGNPDPFSRVDDPAPARVVRREREQRRAARPGRSRPNRLPTGQPKG